MNRAWIEVKVAKKVVEAVDVVSLELVPTKGANLPPFSAGSHIDVELPNGLIRQYSLCNDALQTHRYHIGELLDSDARGGSKSVHNEVVDGSTIRICEPRNHFLLVAADRSILFAGGIGVTPILCMAERLFCTGAEFEMHYCARSSDRTAFVERLESSAFAQRVAFHFDDSAASQRIDARAVLEKPDRRTRLYVCGLKGFMDHVMETARQYGWSEQNIYLEYFAGQTQTESSNSAFEVKIASSGWLIPVAADQSVVAALNAHGIVVPVSYKQGVLGICVTQILSDMPDHRDLYLTDAEKAKNDQMTMCCSRAVTLILVLDL